MKRTEYFLSEEALNAYYPNGVPSGVLAIVQPDAETPAVLYTSSNNSPISGGSSEEQGGAGVTPTGTYNIVDNGEYDVTSYAYAYVDVATDTTADKIEGWQDKFGNALQAVATALYQNDNTLGEPIVKDNADWCVKTALDGDAALSDMVAMSTLWVEIYGVQSMAHAVWSQVLSTMDITVTNADREIPFEVGEDNYMVLSTTKNVCTIPGLAGFKNSNSSNILSNQWSWYGLVYNGTGLEYNHVTDTNNDVDLVAMTRKMEEDGVTTTDIGAPILTLANYINYIKAYENGAKYYWCPDPDNAPTTYYPFVEVTDQGDGSKHYTYSLGDLADSSNGALVANINTGRFNWNGFLYFDTFEIASDTVEGYQESRPIQLVRGNGATGPDVAGGIALEDATLTGATLEIANDDLGFPVLILTNGA